MVLPARLTGSLVRDDCPLSRLVSLVTGLNSKSIMIIVVVQPVAVLADDQSLQPCGWRWNNIETIFAHNE